MIITINGKITDTPDNISTVSDLLEWKNLPKEGTGVAVNGCFVPSSEWKVRRLSPNDAVMIMSAAYGG